jgi:hypothetical protein
VIVTHELGVGLQPSARNDPATPSANGLFELQLNASKICPHLTLCGSTMSRSGIGWQTKKASQRFNLDFVQGVAWGGCE